MNPNILMIFLVVLLIFVSGCAKEINSTTIELNKEDLDSDFIRAEVEYEFQAQTSQTARVVEGFEVA